VTVNLSPAGVTLAAVETLVANPALTIGRRLERFRLVSTPSVAAAGVRSAGEGVMHATRLAAALDGEVITTRDGSMVVSQSTFELPLAEAALRALPFGLQSFGRLICLDVETTGLGTGTGTLAFMVGVGSWDGAQFTVRQFVLADHSQERAMLAGLEAALGDDSALVTYNGRSFDWPLIVARFRLHRRQPPRPAGQLDLLPISRRLWKHRLADARLATVEQHICGVRREHDLSGALVPQRYFDYLARREPQLLVDVAEHNRQDIVSLALLVQALAGLGPAGEARSVAHPGDLRGLARAYARHGRHTDALSCLDQAIGSAHWQQGIVGGAALYRRLATERAHILRRLGRRREALAAWLELAQRGGPGAAAAWLRVARHREHVERDFGGALDACRQATTICARSREWGRPLLPVEADLRHRQARLEKRMKRSAMRRRQPRQAAA